ncbi:MAG: glycosyltransferase [Cyclobacteriaceae bacterium]|nr:glycosyltransferase [Cyclobacteriaceae bacterium]
MSQVNKINRIVIASVLKPVDEPRMFEKIGAVLAHAGHEVHIIGFPSSRKNSSDCKVTLHPISEQNFKRISLTRFIASIKVLFIAVRIRPKYLIIATHELLFAALWCKIFTGCTVFYDIQENYYRNIRYTNAFPVGVRLLLAVWVRIKERMLHPIIETYLLAEKGYAQELPFAEPHIVLENKITRAVSETFRKKENTGYSRLIFTGTLAETTGVLHAITLAEELYNYDGSITLTIVGHCPSPASHKQLLKLAQSHSFITYKGSVQPLPHEAILTAITKVDFGIVWYPPNPSTACSIPTKLYEYLGLNLPVIINHNAESEQLTLHHQAGIILKEPIDYQQLLTEIKAFRLPEKRSTLYFDEDVYPFIGRLK